MTVSWYKDQFKEGIKNINREKDEFKETYFGEDEWNEGLGGKAWYPLKKLGETQDYINDQVNLRNVLRIGKDVTDKIPGKIDEAILDYSYKDLRDHAAGGIGNVAGAITGSETVNDAFELGAQVLLPDAVDFATGVGYADNVIRAAKKFDSKAVRGIIDEAFNAKRVYGPQFNQAKEFVGNWGVKIKDAVTSPYRTVKGAFEGIDAGTGGARAMSGGFGNPFQRKVFYRTGSRSFVKGRGGFDYKDWQNNLKRVLGKSKAKYSLESFQTADTQFVRQFFNKQKEVLKPAFLEEYGEWMAKSGINPDTLELHHIFGVMQSAGLYDGVEHMDEGWRLVTGIMNKNGLFPGAPATDVAKFSNFKYVTKELHDILHSQFLTKKLGIDGSKFFDEKILYNGKKMKRIDIINSGLEGRGFVAEEYAKIIVEGRDLMDEGLLQMEALFSKSGITDPDVLVKVLSKATDKGEIFLGNTDLLLESVNKELQSIAKDVNWQIDTKGMGKIKNFSEDLDTTSRKIKKKYPKK